MPAGLRTSRGDSPGQADAFASAPYPSPRAVRHAYRSTAFREEAASRCGRGPSERMRQSAVANPKSGCVDRRSRRLDAKGMMGDGRQGARPVDGGEAVSRRRAVTELADTELSFPNLPPDPPLQYSLLANGVDFVVAGIEAAFSRLNTENNRYKYAILHVFSGVLLILKERLRREHPALIFDKVESVGDDSARTVDFDTVIRRLQKIAKVSLSDAALATLRSAQIKRNRLEHYEVDLDPEEAQQLINELVEFTYSFLRDELDTDLQAAVSPMAWMEVRELGSIVKRLEAAGELVRRCVRCNRRVYARVALCSECMAYIALDHT
jgi:hypothetical protein